MFWKSVQKYYSVFILIKFSVNLLPFVAAALAL